MTDSIQVCPSADNQNTAAVCDNAEAPTKVDVSTPSRILKWGQESRAIPVPLNEPRHARHSIAFSPSNPLIAFGHKSTLQLLDHSWTTVANLTGLGGTVEGLVFSPDGQWLVATINIERDMRKFSYLRVWRVTDLLEAHSSDNSSDSSATLQRVQETMLRAGAESLLNVAGWTNSEVDKAAEKLRRRLETALEDINLERDIHLQKVIEGGFHSFSQDSSRLFVEADRSKVAIIDLTTRETLHHITHPYHDNESRSGSWGWSNPRYNEGQTIFRNNERVIWVGASPKPKIFATVSWDSTAVLWDEETGDQLFTFDAKTSHQSWIGQFARDGSWFAMGDGGGSVHVWSTIDGQKLATIQNDETWLRTFALSPSGDRLAVGSGRGDVRVYNVSTWEEVVAHRPQTTGVKGEMIAREVQYLQWVDEHRLAFSLASGSIHVLDKFGEEELRIVPENGKEYFGADAVIMRGGGEIWSLDADGHIRIWQV